MFGCKWRGCLWHGSTTNEQSCKRLVAGGVCIQQMEEVCLSQIALSLFSRASRMFVSSVNKLERQSHQLFLLAHAVCSLLPMVLFSCHTIVLVDRMQHIYCSTYMCLWQDVWLVWGKWPPGQLSQQPTAPDLISFFFLWNAAFPVLPVNYGHIHGRLSGFHIQLKENFSRTNLDCGVRVGHQLQWLVPLHICSHCIPPSVEMCTPVCSRPNLRSNARQWIGLHKSVHCALMLIAINIWEHSSVGSIHFFGPSLFNSVLL